jgi:hypothetical protein
MLHFIHSLLTDLGIAREMFSFSLLGFFAKLLLTAEFFGKGRAHHNHP